jgi:hypothetical protein
MRVYEAARMMADEFGLPQDWLNDGVKGLLPTSADNGEQFTTTSEGIHIVVPSPEYLFAMKATSARIGIDDDDLRLLGTLIGVKTADTAYEIVERYYRRERVSAKAGLFIQTLFPEDDRAGRERTT